MLLRTDSRLVPTAPAECSLLAYTLTHVGYVFQAAEQNYFDFEYSGSAEIFASRNRARHRPF
jgi:hypothetical protein